MSAQLRAILALVGSGIMFSTMGALIKVVDHLDAFKTMFFRFGIGLALLGMLGIFRKVKLEFVRSPLLFLRGFFGAIGVFGLYYAITKIGVAKATVINYSYPVFATIGGVVFLKENVRAVQWAAVAAALGGLYLIAAGRGADFRTIEPAALVGVLGAAAGGVALTTVRKLRETDSSVAIYLSQCAVGFWAVVLPAGVVESSIDRWDGVVLVLIGLAAAAGQLFMTYAYRHVPLVIGSLMGLLVPVISLPLGVFIFEENVSATGYAGMAVVLLACGVIIRTRTAPHPPESPDPGRGAAPPPPAPRR